MVLNIKSIPTPPATSTIVYTGGNSSAKGGSGGLLLGIIFAALAVACALAYYMYERPCDLNKHAPTLHKWIFEKTKIKWPKDPDACSDTDAPK